MAARQKNPMIVAIVCTWHPLAAAENAGLDGCRYGPGTTIVPVDCAGTVTTAAILRAFAGNADGVLIAACGDGDCHYANGNESCEKVVAETHSIMKLAGMPAERLRLDLSSDVDGARFADLVLGFASELAVLERTAPAKRRTGRRSSGGLTGGRSAASKGRRKKQAKRPKEPARGRSSR